MIFSASSRPISFIKASLNSAFTTFDSSSTISLPNSLKSPSICLDDSLYLYAYNSPVSGPFIFILAFATSLVTQPTLPLLFNNFASSAVYLTSLYSTEFSSSSGASLDVISFSPLAIISNIVSPSSTIVANVASSTTFPSLSVFPCNPIFMNPGMPEDI